MTNNNFLLSRLTELMLENKNHILPVDLLFDDELIGDFVKSIQIDSPYQQMLLEGVLTESVRDEKLFVSFTVEGYFHYVLGSTLYHLSTNKNADYFVNLILSNSLNGLQEGVTECLVRQCTNSCFDSVIELIDKGEVFHQLSVAPLANSFVFESTEKMISILLQKETEKEFTVLFQILSFLRKQNKIEVINNILKALAIRPKDTTLFTNNFYCSRLRIASLLFEKQEQLLRMAEESIINRKQIISKSDKNKLPILLIDLYSILVSKGHLKFSTLFALKFNIYNFDADLLVNNYYNIIYPLLETGQFELAEKIYERCKIKNNNNGVFLNWSGFIFQSWYELKSNDSNHLKKGLMLYKQSSEIINKEFGAYSLRKYENLENLGYTYGLIGNHKKSLNYLNQAINIVSKSYLSEISYPLGNLYEMKAAALNKLGKYTEALEYTYKSDECKLLQVELNSPELAWNHYDRAKIFMKMGKINDAKNSMSIALEIREKSLGIENELTIKTRKEFGKIANDL
jgi:tetratricopeptide (TPR) repeat protein